MALVTGEDLARMAGCDPSKVTRHRKAGKLPFVAENDTFLYETDECLPILNNKGLSSEDRQKLQDQILKARAEQENLKVKLLEEKYFAQLCKTTAYKKAVNRLLELMEDAVSVFSMAVDGLNLSGKQSIELIEWSLCPDSILDAIDDEDKVIINCDDVTLWLEDHYPDLLPVWEAYREDGDEYPALDG